MWTSKLFIALTVIISIAYGANLYSMVTEFSGSKTETIIWVVSVNMQTGRVTNNTEAFVYAGSSATTDGISAFDQKNGIYYMVTDYITPFIYSVNVAQKRILPTLTTYADSIEHLDWNPTTGNLLAISIYKNAVYLFNIASQTVSPVMQIPTSYNGNYIMTAALDDAKQIYYIAGKIGTSRSATYGLLGVSLPSGNIVNQVAIDPSTCTMFPQRLFFQASSGLIVGGAEAFINNTLEYFFMKINPATGACSSELLKVPYGITTCWTINTDTNTIIFNEVTDNGDYLHFFDVNSNKQLPAVFVGQDQLPESIEYSHLF